MKSIPLFPITKANNNSFLKILGLLERISCCSVTLGPSCFSGLRVPSEVERCASRKATPYSHCLFQDTFFVLERDLQMLAHLVYLVNRRMQCEKEQVSTPKLCDIFELQLGFCKSSPPLVARMG
jgi:hypothetical protein